LGHPRTPIPGLPISDCFSHRYSARNASSKKIPARQACIEDDLSLVRESQASEGGVS